MIESIQIADVATFPSIPETLSDLSTINFIFGANATGKTTISRLIANENSFANCKVNWKGGTRLQPMVYNHDFIESNINQCTELKGVFTLGEKNKGLISKIDEAKDELDKIIDKIEKLSKTLQGDGGAGGIKGDIAILEAELTEICWEQKKKYDDRFQVAFKGYRNDTKNFKDKILEESKVNSSALLALAELEKKAKTIFGPVPINENSIPSIDIDPIIAHEANSILKKRVIGKEDVNIAAMIKKLGNSDWVKEGRRFYNANDKVCPFCQQKTKDEFAQSLIDYFDDAFEKDSRTIDDLITNYKADSDQIFQQIAAIISDPSKFINIEKLKEERDLLNSKITVNMQRLRSKQKEPSQVVELESISNVASTIKKLLGEGNVSIFEHNRLVSNLSEERSTLTAQVWKYLLEVELKADLSKYQAKRDRLNKAIVSLIEQISSATVEKKKKENEIRELEKQTTSIQPTIDGINSILKSFGFQSFSIAKADNRTCYKLVRADGTDAKSTLSEGEKNFVTFLYFFYLLKGSESESGMTTNRIVVIDDPVSRLDSDILFIVSTLIKGLFKDIREGIGTIKQVFILTHNVYFHKEVTFNRKRTNGAMKEETFWLVRKSGLISKIEKHDSNPIKTSYELLWAEIKKPDRSNLTIRNTMRRILENYFTIFGRFEFDDICEKFEGNEKLIYRSLFSWLQEGSHYAHDDLYMTLDDASVDIYLKVFKAIFEKSGHGAHYDMMMENDSN